MMARGGSSSTIAVLGVTAYLVGFAFRLAYDIPLLTLAICGVAAVIADRRSSRGGASPLILPVLVFFLATAASLLASDQVERGFRLSLPLLPGALIFSLIGWHLESDQDVRRVHRALAIAALVIGGTVLRAVAVHPTLEPAALLRVVASPLLLAPNDIVMLAVIAPLTASLMLCATSPWMRLVTGLSLVVSAIAIVLLQSRVAVLTFLGTLTCVAAFRSRRGAVSLMLTIAIVLAGADALRGWPLLHKFDDTMNPRVALWVTALAMFRDAPWFGHGPHTFGILRGPYLSRLELPSWLPSDDRVVPWAHSLYFESLAEQGAVGFLALMALLTTAVGLAWRNTRTADAADDRALAVGAFAAMLGFCGAALVELTFLRQWVVILMFTLLGIIGRRASTSRTLPGGIDSPAPTSVNRDG